MASNSPSLQNLVNDRDQRVLAMLTEHFLERSFSQDGEKRSTCSTNPGKQIRHRVHVHEHRRQIAFGIYIK